MIQDQSGILTGLEIGKQRDVNTPVNKVHFLLGSCGISSSLCIA